MRCPECKHIQGKKEGRRCKKCNYHFVLLPGEGIIHDYKLLRIAENMSKRGQYAFTRSQLIAEVLRANPPNLPSLKSIVHQCRPFSILPFLMVIFVFFDIHLTILLGFILVIVIIMCLLISLFVKLYTLIYSDRASAKQHAKITAEIDKYLAVHEIPGLVDGKSLKRDVKSTTTTPDYLQGMAPEAILVVERDDLVDALVKSNFHMHNKTVVVSQFGYPQQVFDALPGFIKASPQIPVLVAHDLSQAGLKLIDKLKHQSKWAFAASNFKDGGLSLNSFGDYSSRLPWINAQGQLVMSNKHQKQLEKGGHLPLDSFPSTTLSALFAATVASSGLVSLGALLASSSDSASGGSSDFG